MANVFFAADDEFVFNETFFFWSTIQKKYCYKFDFYKINIRYFNPYFLGKK